MALYKRICKGTFEVTGAMSVEFRMLMIAILYPNPTQRLGSSANGWHGIFDAPWVTNSSSSLDLKKLRKQTLPAPLIPSDLDANQSDKSKSFIHQPCDTFDDLFDNAICGRIAAEHQHNFSSFGSHFSSPIGNIVSRNFYLKIQRYFASQIQGTYLKEVPKTSKFRP